MTLIVTYIFIFVEGVERKKWQKEIDFGILFAKWEQGERFWQIILPAASFFWDIVTENTRRQSQEKKTEVELLNNGLDDK